MSMKFEWDETKNRINRKKHGLWFEEAQTVFDDPFGRLFMDDSKVEDRFILVGMSASYRVLLIVHCYCESDSIVRIISARKATKNERGFYEKGV